MRAQNCFINNDYIKTNTISCWYKLSIFLVLTFWRDQILRPNQQDTFQPLVPEMTLFFMLSFCFKLLSVALVWVSFFLSFLCWVFSRWNSFLIYCDLFCFSLLVFQFPFFSCGNVCSPLLPYSAITDYRISSACQYIPYLLYPSDRVWLSQIFFLMVMTLIVFILLDLLLLPVTQRSNSTWNLASSLWTEELNVF